MLERMAGNDGFVNRCLSDPDFRTVIFGGLARELFAVIRDDSGDWLDLSGNVLSGVELCTEDGPIGGVDGSHTDLT